MSDTTALTLSTATDDAAAASIQHILRAIGTGELSIRQVRRLERAAAAVGGVAVQVTRIATLGHEAARASAKTARDIEQFSTEIDDLQTKRAANEALRAESAARAKLIGEVIQEELRARKLGAKLDGDAFQERLDLAKAARQRETERIDIERAATRQRVDRAQTTRSARAAAARQKNEDEATRITRAVQIGAVPAGTATPYHAYAACVYLAGKLDDGLSSEDAAARTREAVLAQMLGREITADEIEAYHAAYRDLKERAAAQARHRSAQEILAAAEQFTGAVQ